MMGSRVTVRMLVAQYGWWVGLLAVPLAVNGLLWTALVVPQRHALQAWHDADALATLAPKLEAFLIESRRMVLQWNETGFTREDSAAAIQAIRRVGERHRVRINEVSTKGVPADSMISVEADVAGSFSKLGRWMSDLESQAGLQIDSWALRPDERPDEPHQLTVHLSAFLR